MSMHPINLVVRFILELGALLAMGLWGWQKGENWLRYLLAFGIPIIAAAVWGTFRVPNDPGAAPVAVPGILRLAYEIIFFAFATWAIYDAGHINWAWVFGIVTLVHYLLSYDRILWIIKQ